MEESRFRPSFTENYTHYFHDSTAEIQEKDALLVCKSLFTPSNLKMIILREQPKHRGKDCTIIMHEHMGYLISAILNQLIQKPRQTKSFAVSRFPSFFPPTSNYLLPLEIVLFLMQGKFKVLRGLSKATKIHTFCYSKEIYIIIL